MALLSIPCPSAKCTSSTDKHPAGASYGEHRTMWRKRITAAAARSAAIEDATSAPAATATSGSSASRSKFATCKRRS